MKRKKKTHDQKKQIRNFIKFARGANKAPDICAVPPSILLKIFFELHVRDTRKIETPMRVTRIIKEN